jgi:hypothetical protein
MRENRMPIDAPKDSVRAAADYTDQWIEDHTADWVSGLPPAFRTGTNAAQKIALFAFVLWRKAGRLRADEDG